MAHDIFISYPSKNKPVADAICARLEASHIRCWIAPRDILPGQNYAEALFDAIGSSKIFILVLSENTNHSPHIISEVQRAFNTNRVLIPFRIEDIEPSKALQYYLGSSHWLDALSPPIEQKIDELVQVVRVNLQITPEVSQRPPGESGDTWKKTVPDSVLEKPRNYLPKIVAAKASSFAIIAVAMLVLLGSAVILPGMFPAQSPDQQTGFPAPKETTASSPSVPGSPIQVMTSTSFQSKSSPEVQRLVLDLQSDSYETRVAAQDGLVRIGPSAIDAVVPLLRNQSYIVRYFAADTLMRLDYRPTTSEEKAYLIVGTRQYDAGVHKDNFTALVAAGPMAVDPLILFLKDPNYMKGSGGDSSDALVAIGRPAVPKLITALQDPVAREYAGISLILIGDPEGRQAVFDLMGQQHINLSSYAANYKLIIIDKANSYKNMENSDLLWLCLAVEAYGTKDMAQAYLNAGDPLRTFGERWATAHGYLVTLKGLEKIP